MNKFLFFSAWRFVRMNKILVKVIKVFSLVLFVLLVSMPFSCRLSDEGITLVSFEETSPEMIDYSVCSDEKLSVTFSKKISVVESLVFDENENLNHSVFVSADEKDNFWTVDFELKNKLEIGKTYELFGVVRDENLNTLTFCIPFKGYNNRVPRLKITEIRPIYSASDKTVTVNGEKIKTKVYKSEFIELKSLSDGNLCGVEIVSGNDGEDRKITLPALEVKKDEIIIVHLRTHAEEKGAVSELESDFTLSTGYYSSDFARDIWIENEKKILDTDQDVVVLRDSQTQTLLDAVLYSNSKKAFTDWKTTFMKDLLNQILSQNLWESDSESGELSVSSAFDSIGLTATKSILRIGVKNCSESFQISKSNGETPGNVLEEAIDFF